MPCAPLVPAADRLYLQATEDRRLTLIVRWLTLPRPRVEFRDGSRRAWEPQLSLALEAD